MPTRTDTSPSSDTLGIPAKRLPPKRVGEPLEHSCPLCPRPILSQDTVLFWRTDDGQYVVVHPDCARTAAARKSVAL